MNTVLDCRLSFNEVVEVSVVVAALLYAAAVLYYLKYRRELCGISESHGRSYIISPWPDCAIDRYEMLISFRSDIARSDLAFLLVI
jgi:hypothetical protein